MSREKNIASQQAFGEAVNAGDFAAFDELVAPDSVDHDPAPGQAAGPEGYAAFFGELRTAFPDMALAVEKLVADEDSVAFAYTLTGTHTGVFQGFEPTGRAISIRGMQISSFVDGRLAERWGSSDELGILKQLGLAPAA
ncbi:ester cyclase [Rathayibacter sp. VKM Ac-2803]|uniref:ester cyclase n=1 Tax=unclassified Rathayibacter TaxID=2609250 RepID=UPI00135C8046|nr:MULTISPECIES: ester cyclase [unclassified Rathayibacter]MWV51330.1 ester cyclase [Rathayibacter sp. VKM Ac-2803]MWV57805.1 ester cyclase [Rathayibacter sp. VKM Ac-2754]